MQFIIVPAEQHTSFKKIYLKIQWYSSPAPTEDTSRPHTFIVSRALEVRDFLTQHLPSGAFGQDDYRKLCELVTKYLRGQVSAWCYIIIGYLLIFWSAQFSNKSSQTYMYISFISVRSFERDVGHLVGPGRLCDASTWRPTPCRVPGPMSLHHAAWVAGCCSTTRTGNSCVPIWNEWHYTSHSSMVPGFSRQPWPLPPLAWTSSCGTTCACFR